MILAAVLCLIGFLVLDRPVLGDPLESLDVNEFLNPDSDRLRAIQSMGAKATSGPNFKLKRLRYPETNPHVCLAFLSCCERTDLLNHTIAGAIRHMEEDEPSFLRYEIAWVDNGNSETSTDYIKDSYPIEHALTLPSNMGLAYGMNLLVNNLCTAPYILLLEEDWLYLDDAVAEQTEERKRSIATSIALLENLEANNITAFDGRNIIGTFLRHEVYETYGSFPYADVWERRKKVNLTQMLSSIPSDSCESTAIVTDEYVAEEDNLVDIDYRIFCSHIDFKSETSNVFGSYTNGAGLYRRSDLIEVGRNYGEPGDIFHNRYVESNYAFRVGLRNCHAALRLTKDESCKSISDVRCTGAFHHIGGGRGTIPQKAKEGTCMDPGWNFFGAPLYAKYQKMCIEIRGTPCQRCSMEKLAGLRQQHARDLDADAYREQVKKSNLDVFEKDAQQRQVLRDQSKLILEMLNRNEGDLLRTEIPSMKDLSDSEIAAEARRLEKFANSPHPMPNLWDLHGRIKKSE